MPHTPPLRPSRAGMLGVALCLALGAPAVATPPHARVAPGWPVMSNGPSAALVPLPTGGVVQISPEPTAGASFQQTAFTSSGDVLWNTFDSAGCGNCDGGAYPRVQADGTIGPVGYLGDGFWSLDSDGRRIAGCTGTVRADTTCVDAELLPNYRVPGNPTATTLRATRAGVAVWRTPVTGFPALTPDFLNHEPVVVDDAGVGYVRLTGTDPQRPSLLLAFDAATGAERWRQEGTTASLDRRLLAALPDGVLVERVRNGETTVAAIDAAGAVRWQVPAPAFVDSWLHATVDGTHNRVYVAGMHGRGARVWDLATGSDAWTPPAGFSLLSVGPAGALWAVETPTRHQLRATDPSGSTRWVWDSLTPVRDAVAREGNEVYVTTQGTADYVPSAMFLLRQVGRSAAPTRHAAQLVRNSPDPTWCTAEACSFTGREGRLLRLRSPRAGRVTVVVRTAGYPKAFPRIVATVPRGEHWLRLPTPYVPAGGVMRVQVRWGDGTTRTLRIPNHPAPQPSTTGDGW